MKKTIFKKDEKGFSVLQTIIAVGALASVMSFSLNAYHGVSKQTKKLTSGTSSLFYNELVRIKLTELTSYFFDAMANYQNGCREARDWLTFFENKLLKTGSGTYSFSKFDKNNTLPAVRHVLKSDYPEEIKDELKFCREKQTLDKNFGKNDIFGVTKVDFCYIISSTLDSSIRLEQANNAPGRVKLRFVRAQMQFRDNMNNEDLKCLGPNVMLYRPGRGVNLVYNFHAIDGVYRKQSERSLFKRQKKVYVPLLDLVAYNPNNKASKQARQDYIK